MGFETCSQKLSTVNGLSIDTVVTGSSGISSISILISLGIISSLNASCGIPISRSLEVFVCIYVDELIITALLSTPVSS